MSPEITQRQVNTEGFSCSLYLEVLKVRGTREIKVYENASYLPLEGYGIQDITLNWYPRNDTEYPIGHFLRCQDVAKMPRKAESKGCGEFTGDGYVS
jgi:hypothetical protein